MPDERLRAREIQRQSPVADATFSLACDGPGGDRIRWTLVEPNTELRVIRSWGQGRPPAPGDSLDQRMSDLFRRGCVREPWEDEDQRARMVAEAEKEARRWGRSRGLSM